MPTIQRKYHLHAEQPDRISQQVPRPGLSLVGFFSARSKFNFIFCLFAVLANVLLPLAHQCHCHLHTCEESNPASFLVSSEASTPALEAGDPEPDEHHSHHDPATCPICQTILHAGRFTISTVISSPVPSLQVLRICHLVSISIIVSPDILNSKPRSPPISL